jgi:lysophospholipase L1-like esterase
MAFLIVFLFFFTLETLARLYKTAEVSLTLSPRISFKLNPVYLKYGFEYLFPREKRFSVKNENCNYLIKAYGGSTTYGFGVEKKDSYPGQLQVILREHFHTDKIDVHNQGICAGASEKAVADMLSGLPSDLPNKNRKTIFIFYEGINDAIRMVSAGHIKTEVHYEMDRFEMTPLQRVYFTLKKTILFFSVIDSYLKNTDVYKRVLSSQHKLSEGNISDKEFVEKLLKRYENNLMTFVNVCRVYDIKLIFGKVTLRLEKFVSYDKDLYLKYYNMVFGIMEKVAKENNIPFVDADAYFRGLPNSGRFFLYSGEDWCHLNEEGNRILAGLFAKVIIDNGYIK